jgi:hypothetical protein
VRQYNPERIRRKLGNARAMAAKQSTTKPKDVPDEVQRAIRLLKEAHEVGQQILQDCGRRSEYGKNSIEVAAEHHGISAEKARKFRQFADPVDGYTLAELRTLCRLCLRHKTALGIHAVYRFMTVPRDGKKPRSQFQREAIEERWNRLGIDANLRHLFGKRRKSGRRPTIPKEPANQLDQILHNVERWLRWTSTSRDRAEGAEVGPLFPDLAVTVQKRLAAVDRAMKKLGREVDREVGEPFG